MCIDFTFTVAQQRALCNCLCHWRFTNYENVFFYGFYPQFVLLFKCAFFDRNSVQTLTENTVRNVQGIQTGFRVDFQNVCVDVCKCSVCYVALIYKTRFFQSVGKVFVIKAPTAQTVAHMHVDYSPRGKNCFLVRVLEHGKLRRYFLHAFERRKFVGGKSHIPYLLTGGDKNVLLVIL